MLADLIVPWCTFWRTGTVELGGKRVVYLPVALCCQSNSVAGGEQSLRGIIELSASLLANFIISHCPIFFVPPKKRPDIYPLASLSVIN